MIHNQVIAQVKSHNYLGVYIDSTLTWSTQVNYLCGRLQQRLYFLRRLRIYGVSKNIMFIFYHAVLESLVRYSIIAWYGTLAKLLTTKLIRFAHLAWRIISEQEHLSLQDIYEQGTVRLVNKIFF